MLNMKNNYGCLTPTEEIVVRDGYKMMCDINEGNQVLSHDGEYHKVTKVWHFKKPSYYISFSNGDHLECSNTHRLLINKNKIDKNSSWKTVEELHDGDEVFVMNTINLDDKIKMNRLKISRIFKSGNETEVIDLTLKDSCTYVSANGIINHCAN